MAKLSEVFGIMQQVPTYTYVDRAGLDERFRYLLSTDRHVVIYGASKQGKTSLRRKVIDDDTAIIVRCRLKMKLEDVYGAMLQGLGVPIPVEQVKSYSLSGTAGGEVSGQIGLLGIAKAETKVSGEVGAETATETTSRVSGTPTENLDWLATQILRSKKRVVIEDFHYLTEDERQRLAFDLKALWDAGVFFIIIGIWAQHDLLTYYNGDLSGRVEDVDLVWADEELEEVLRKGEEALNIRFEPQVRAALLRDAAQNVGLLQRLAERLCFECRVLATEDTLKEIGDAESLSRTRAIICRSEQQRYKQFSDAVTRGFKAYEESELKVYEHIVRVCVEAGDVELRNGLPKDVLLKRIQQREDRVRMSDLSAALNKLDRLQSERDISPLVLTFSGGKISLVDRELLFFRRYGDSQVWPWHDEDAADGKELLAPERQNLLTAAEPGSDPDDTE